MPKKKFGIEADFLILNLKLNLQGIHPVCHDTAKIICGQLKELGYKVKVVTGVYYNPPHKIIRHSWIEFKDKILETDCRQLMEEGDIMPKDFCAVLEKKKFAHRYLQGGLNENRH